MHTPRKAGPTSVKGTAIKWCFQTTIANASVVAEVTEEVFHQDGAMPMSATTSANSIRLYSNQSIGQPVGLVNPIGISL